MAFHLDSLKQFASVDALKQRSRQLVEQAGEFRQSAQQRAEAAAEQVAGVCTDWTGREVSADHVKHAARTAAKVTAGVGAVMVLGAAARSATQAVGGALGDVTGSLYDGSDVNASAGRLVAENGGSLNFETVPVDEWGCEI